MTEIIDLGNGYGKVVHYDGPYASLNIALKPGEIRRLYNRGYLSRDEYYHWLLYLGYTEQQVDVFYALDVSVCKLESEGFYSNLLGKEVDYD